MEAILILAIPCIIGFMPAPAGLSNWRGCFLVFTWRPLWGWLSSFPGTCRTVNCRRRIDGRGGYLSGGEFKTTAVLSGYSSGTPGWCFLRLL